MEPTRIKAYLHRIGIERPEAPTSAALRELHLAHLRTVPFENLSIHLDEDIALTDEALVAKIVDSRRGGFCYELNGAFAALLTALGFQVTRLQARVYGAGGHLGIPYDHMALHVRTADSGLWLADVGFGDHSHLPLALLDRGDQTDPGGTFRIVDAPGGDLEIVKDGRPSYLLDQRPRALRDFEAACWYHRTSPASHFTRSLVCSRLTEDGRVTLSGRRLTTTVGGERHVTELTSDADIRAVYVKLFGISLDRLPGIPSTSGTPSTPTPANTPEPPES
jgi:N-hydroxyarylamine O-acetyltransferase